jgi:hypothetical protein
LSVLCEIVARFFHRSEMISLETASVRTVIGE